MLKTQVGNEVWLVHQPDHARVAGYLAAHWGNSTGFTQPGFYAPSPDAELLRQEVVHAIAEHDNGWWEWEAAPSIDPADGLPRDLPDVSKERVDAGLQRWRMGVPRLAETHPYVALLISMHAYYLYAFAFEDLPGLDDALRHPIFGRVGTVNKLIANPELTRTFLREQLETQQTLKKRLQDLPLWAAAIDPRLVLPHARLLQTMDALSLLLSFNASDERDLADIPRGNWEDRVTMSWRPQPGRRIVCDPYPFDADPLMVHLPVRVLAVSSSPDVTPPMLRLHRAPLTAIRFELASR